MPILTLKRLPFQNGWSDGTQPRLCNQKPVIFSILLSLKHMVTTEAAHREIEN